ncbi:MAG: hypothetical protein ABJ239_10660 [Erythrobacter sp.]
MEQSPHIKLWIIGLVMFALVIALGAMVSSASVFGITDHQAAGTADQVDLIQADWRDNGVRTIAIISMIGDLLFIGVYGWGSYVAGRSFARMSNAAVRAIGWIVALAAIVFLVTDYVETILQVIQLIRESGSDLMAGIAATAQPVKSVAWIVTFFGVIAALIIRRLSGQST